MPDYIDPLRPGNRNDRIQELFSKYKEICRNDGLALAPKIREEASRQSPKEEESWRQATSWRIVAMAHALAVNIIESREFRPLKENWRDRVSVQEQDHQLSRLEDIGALEFIRAIWGGES